MLASIALLSSGCQKALRYDRLPEGRFPGPGAFRPVKGSFQDTLYWAPGEQLLLSSRFCLLGTRHPFGMPLMRAWLLQMMGVSPELDEGQMLAYRHAALLQSARSICTQPEFRRRMQRLERSRALPRATPAADPLYWAGPYADSLAPTRYWHYSDSFAVVGRYRHVFTIVEHLRSKAFGLSPTRPQRRYYHFDLLRRKRLVLQDIVAPRQMPLLHRLLQLQCQAEGIWPGMPREAYAQIRATEQFQPRAEGLAFYLEGRQAEMHRSYTVVVPWVVLQGVLRESFWAS